MFKFLFYNDDYFLKKSTIETNSSIQNLGLLEYILCVSMYL